MEAMRQEWDDDRLDLLDAKVEAGFGRMDDEFAKVDKRFAEVDQRFAGVDQRFTEIDHRFDLVDQQFQHVNQRLDKVEGGVEALAREMNSRFDSLHRTLIYVCVGTIGVVTMLAGVALAQI